MMGESAGLFRNRSLRPLLAHAVVVTIGLPLFAAGPLSAASGEWSAHPSAGVEMKLSREGLVNRLDFDFQHHAGYAIAHEGVDLDLPPNYQISFRLRGDAPPENLELKLIDESGENVWWRNRRDFVFPHEWTVVNTRQRQIEFAWGPAGGGRIQHVASLEVVVTAGSGGKGTVWFDDPKVEPLPVVSDTPLRFDQLPLDLGVRREIGGLEIDWRKKPATFRLSLDGIVQTRTGSRFVRLPDTEARRIDVEGGEIRSVTVEPPSWAPTENDFLAIEARAARRGDYPRYLIGEQPYWTVVGADGAGAEALVGEDGSVEPFKGGFSIEPFLLIDGQRVSWAGASITQSLAEGDLPIPTVTWTVGAVTMTMTAAVSSTSMLQMHYSIRGDRAATLLLAIRPFQVNPSTQFLNTTGGAAHIATLRHEARRLIVNGDEIVNILTKPSDFDRGDVGGAPAAGALVYHDARSVEISVPLAPGARSEPLTTIASAWRGKLHRVAVEIPGAPEVARTLRSSLAYALILRHGAALEPGSRSYDRSWIRDGSLLGWMLLRLGHVEEAKAFARWFAGFQYPDGMVPCCVDHRGADPVPENDSHGELIFLVAEIWRVTHDQAFLRELWPHVDAAARYIDLLRSRNHGEFEGLLTESISHEGYSARPVHSYWDDVFGLKGLQDAAMLAGVVGMPDRAATLEGQAADFRRDLQRSMQRTAEEHAIDYVPASAELGDFDPTSTAIAISPVGLGDLMPEAAIRRTYDEYFNVIAKPREDYTPYEMRIIGALIRRGEKTAALELIDRFLLDRRPPAWNEWAEVVGTDDRKPRFIGDMPHAWVASDFVRSILDAFAFEREDGALVIGAGVPRRWIGKGMLHVGPLATSTGSIDVRMRATTDRIDVELKGDAKPRLMILRSPDERPLRGVTVDGSRVAHSDHEVTIATIPASVVLEY